MIVSIRALDRDRRTCRAHDARDARRVLTYTRACEDSLLRALSSGGEVLVEIDRGEIVVANLVVREVRS